MSSTNSSFKPALLVIDVQEDFCPPNGSLAVAQGRDIAPLINQLLAYPFALKVASKDWHPRDHISFASHNPGSKPFESTVTIQNPEDPNETQVTQLWPDHCVQGTSGAEIIPEIDVSKIQHVVEKGTDSNMEMYSAFRPPFKRQPVGKSRMSEILKSEGITHAYVVGLAYDYCVLQTALHAAEEGLKTYLIEDATRAVSPNSVADVRKKLEEAGVTIVQSDSEEVRRIQG